VTCPFCGHVGSKVVDKRDVAEGIRRRRECEGCGRRYSSIERVDRRMPQVVKRGGDRQPFDAEKVRAGLLLACRKRPVSPEQIDAACARVEQRVYIEGVGGEVDSRKVGEMVLEELRGMDPVAFLRFASVYHQTDSPEQFLDLVRPLVRE
jgi:transcriptional repressor NrdR